MVTNLPKNGKNIAKKWKTKHAKTGQKDAPKRENCFTWNNEGRAAFGQFVRLKRYKKNEQNTPKKGERSAASAVKRSEKLYAKGNTKKANDSRKREGERSHTKRLETFGINLYYIVLVVL